MIERVFIMKERALKGRIVHITEKDGLINTETAGVVIFRLR